MANKIGKGISLAVAVMMLMGGFALLAMPTKAAAYHGFAYADINDGSVPRIQDSTDSTVPNGAVARWWKATEPQYNNQQFLTAPGGTPYIGMSDWVGATGQSTQDYASFYQTTGAAGPSNVVNGELIYHIIELDKNVVASPRSYYSTVPGDQAWGFTQRGAVPNGYLWGGNDLATGSADDEILPGTAPATTFFRVYQMPLPTFNDATTNSWSFPEHEPTVVGDTNNQITNWMLLEGPAAGDNDGPWVQVGATAAYGATITYDRQDNFWYSVRVVWTGGVSSAVLSSPRQEVTGWSDAIAPVVTVSSTDFAGDTTAEYVTITGTVTDGPANGNGYAGAAYVQVDGGAWAAATMSTTNTTAANTYTYTYNFPSGAAGVPPTFVIGAHTVNVRAWDNSSNLGTATTNFDVSDSEQALASYTGLTPAHLSSKTAGAQFVIDVAYEDFTNFSLVAGACEVDYQVNAGAWQQAALTMNTFAWGSYVVGLRATFIPVAVAGDTVSFYATVDDDGGGAPRVLATRTVNILAAGSQVDTYPIWGRVELYNGNAAGTYTPVYPAAIVNIDITYWNESLAIPAYTTYAIQSDAAGFYTFDLYSTLDLTMVYLHVAAFPGYGNVGDNVTQVDSTNFPMGRQQKIMCGIPSNVVITVPITGSTVTVGQNVIFWYNITDRSGVRAQGYYDYNDGLFEWLSNMPGFAAPGLQPFDGITTTDGAASATINMAAVGTWWFNTTEEDLVVVDPYLTPWNAITYTAWVAGAPVTGNNWLKDWANITLIVVGGGFDWRLYDGWNLVSAPQEAIRRAGVNAFFDAEDAIEECVVDMLANVPSYDDPNIKIATKNNAVIPSTYTDFVRGDLETPLTFAITPTAGYWVYVTPGTMGAGNCVIHFDSVNWTSAGTISVVLAANWNLLGFAHNDSGVVDWSAGLTASDWVTGVVDTDINVLVAAGPQTLVIATMWAPATQWYQSYVREQTPWFPGIAVRDWGWDTYVNSNNPGNGCWLWVSNVVTLDYDVDMVY